MQRTSTCLWFNDQAEQAVAFYTSLFPNSRIVHTTYYLEGAPTPAGSVLTIQFTLDGTEYLALNGGPAFTFSPAVSMVAYCDTQAEVDRLWARLSDGGQDGQCGWLTDRFGVSWQVVPRQLLALLNTPGRAASQRAFAAMMTMKKLDIAALQRAYAGA
jgi:predicted 3-demethylubiquinone-9 3-methyltransferase (glyoxalase superfamily)